MVIRILIVDDNTLVRIATKMVLSTCSDFLIAGEASDGRTGIRMAMELQPDVVLMDINMQPVDGITATRLLLSKWPSALVIGFSALPHPHQEQEMIDAGAAGVIQKSAAREVIIREILRFYRQRVENRE